MTTACGHDQTQRCRRKRGRPQSDLIAGLFSTTIRAACIALVVASATHAIAAETAGEDWPQFLGPRGDNTSTETGLLEKWPANGPPLLWEKEIGSGYSAPSVRDGRLVLHARVGDEEVVEAFEAATGKPQWRYAYPSHFADPFGYNNGPRCTPLLTSDRCYTFGAEGRLICLDVQNGHLVWQRATAKEWNVPEAFFGVGSTPLLEDDKLIVMVGGQPNSAVVALDATAGKTIWENGGKKNWEGVSTIGWRGEAPYHWSGEEKLASYSSPVAATVHGKRHIFCLTRQGLISLSPANGAINFCRWFESPVNESVNAMCPVLSGDLVLISAAYYRIGAVLLRIKPDGKSFDEIWRSPRSDGERDAITGRPASPVLEIHWNTPVLHDGYLYAFSGRNEPDATFRCIELLTGKLLWSREERWRPHSSRQPEVYGRGSAIVADGKLIVLGEGGKLGLFALNPKQPEEICAWQVPQLHYPCWAGPVLSHRKLYLRSEDRLVCFDLNGETTRER
ncbi:MAG TPA: PQQ-binding-like beta-propeller repeat protein [Candidatus Limnocylindrales bacterium]|nr:PQQ-binding-like beta-propeller repeat protein [Candidatus Limnocylindrales bacterium]